MAQSFAFQYFQREAAFVSSEVSPIFAIYTVLSYLNFWFLESSLVFNFHIQVCRLYGFSLAPEVFKELDATETLHINSAITKNIETKWANLQNGDKWL